MTEPVDIPWAELESLVRRDAGRRGVAGFVEAEALAGVGQLEAAARGLAGRAGTVAIVTGFCVADADHPAAETDGPPGALRLARTLAALGAEVVLVSDAYGLPLLQAGCAWAGLEGIELMEFPFEDGAADAEGRRRNEPPYTEKTDAWVDSFLASAPGSRLTHLIAVERAGPSHTLDSLAGQRRGGPVPTIEFEREVPPGSRNVCHNMRGMPINGYTGKTHRLFEAVAARKLPVTTIGVGDGGNEIGMGSIAWEVLRKAIRLGYGGRIACRIPTDHTLVAGVSNWAAYALAASASALAGRGDLVWDWELDRERELIRMLVHDAGAVDGVSRRQEATVDGVPLEAYLQTLAGIRNLCSRG